MRLDQRVSAFLSRENFRWPTLMTLIAAALTMGGCGAGEPVDVERTLQMAGPNRGQLEQAIEHFRDAADPRKLEAIYFLIANMRFHLYEDVGLFNANGQEVRLDYFFYRGLTELRRALRDFEKQSGETHWGLRGRREDARSISAQQLIENVDQAFRVWRERPWAQELLTWETFRDVILPYRMGNESLEDWRGRFQAQYRQLPDLLTDPQDPLQAAREINRDLGSWFGFDDRLYFRRTDMSASEMWRDGLGRCEDFAHLAAMAMRANAIPVSVDFTPYWPNSHGNHFWNVVHVADKDIPFTAGDVEPGQYSFQDLGLKAAKVYRKTFAEQPTALPFHVVGKATVPAFLASRHLQDVTEEYMPISEVEVRLTAPLGDNQIAYLAVFNSGEWNPIDWALVEGTRAVFRKIGTGIVYLPVFFEGGRIRPAAAPFILGADGEVESLGNAGKEVAPVTLRWVKPNIVHGDGILQAPGGIIAGRAYRLYRWEDGWVEQALAVASEPRLAFPDMNSGLLYWLVEEGRGDEERVFTIRDGEPSYW